MDNFEGAVSQTDTGYVFNTGIKLESDALNKHKSDEDDFIQNELDSDENKQDGQCSPYIYRSGFKHFESILSYILELCINCHKTLEIDILLSLNTNKCSLTCLYRGHNK